MYKRQAPGKRILTSLFQSVTPRTAGFNTMNLIDMSEAGQSIVIVLMLIGGSPGSVSYTHLSISFTSVPAIGLSNVSPVWETDESSVFSFVHPQSTKRLEIKMMDLNSNFFIKNSLS